LSHEYESWWEVSTSNKHKAQRDNESKYNGETAPGLIKLVQALNYIYFDNCNLQLTVQVRRTTS